MGTPAESRSKSESASKPTLAVFKLASCDGCQLSLLDCEDELLSLTSRLTIGSFAEASSTELSGPYDVVLVEGSVATVEAVHRVQEIRRQAKVLVAIGACATAGGIQGLRALGDVAAMSARVYPEPSAIARASLPRSMAVADHVRVDHELRGCPIDKGQLLVLLGALLRGHAPRLPGHSVCLDCKLAGNACVLVTRATPCLGPVTRTGCGALCPSYGRGCYGCFGPAEQVNAEAMSGALLQLGLAPAEVARLYRTYNACAPPFEAAAVELG